MKEKKSEYAIVLKDESPIGLITERDIVQHYTGLECPEEEEYICKYWQDSLRSYQVYTYHGKAKQWSEYAGFY